jgi:hypothetical protein
MNRLRAFTTHPEYQKLGEWVKNEQEGAERDCLSKVRAGDHDAASVKAGYALALEKLAGHLQTKWDEARKD